MARRHARSMSRRWDSESEGTSLRLMVPSAALPAFVATPRSAMATSAELLFSLTAWQVYVVCSTCLNSSGEASNPVVADAVETFAKGRGDGVL